jgi:C4-dicarboxylate-specific signal transduction histidine kinase
MNLLAYDEPLSEDPVYPPAQEPGTAVTASDRNASTLTALQAARLLEQLLQIARVSALEEMASGVAHELNQPIGAIATFAQTAERMLGRPEPMVTDAHELLHHIGNEALKAGDGIRRIRSLFAAPSVATVECQLGDVIAELRPLLELLAARAGATLEFQIAADLPPVEIDRLRIQHVLFTLVQNALEARCQPGDASRVRVELNGDRYGVMTTVSDRGLGISAIARDNLFRPFFTTKANGTGLGLASSRAIVEAHEGTIGCEDTAGGGATFWFHLPAAAPETST